MRDGDACSDSRFGTREGRVRVAVDEHPVRPFPLEGFEDQRAHGVGVSGVQVEPVCGLGQSELLEEDLGKLPVPVLARVEDDLLLPRRAQRLGYRPGLDELWPVPDDGEDLHAAQHRISAAVRGGLMIASGLTTALVSGSVLAGAGLSASSPAPQIRVSPAMSVADQPIDLRVVGLAPHEVVSVGLHSIDTPKTTWRSSARFAADARGDVDIARATSLSGSYTGVWGMGLLASMRSTRPGPFRAYVWRRPGANVFAATVKADGHVIASTTFRRAWSRPALIEQDETVSSAGFVGAFDSAAGATHRTAVLAFGGSEGGLRTDSLAARLAADGVPTLALAYFGAPGLPQTLTNIPLEYFEKALGWLARQPQVDPQRIVVLGISRGSEAALLLGVHDSDLVHGVIALVPSSVVNCGIQGGGVPSGCIGAAWTLGGKALPYNVPPGIPSPADVIPVEQIAGPILLACGGVDQVWPSCQFAEAIVSRLDANHVKRPHPSYTYLTAGHNVGTLIPYQPGGAQLDTNVPFDEQARENLWPRVLSFLRALR